MSKTRMDGLKVTTNLEYSLQYKGRLQYKIINLILVLLTTVEITNVTHRNSNLVELFYPVKLLDPQMPNSCLAP